MFIPFEEARSAMYCSRSLPHPRLCSRVLRTGWNTCALSSGVICELRCPTQESHSPSFRFPLFPSQPHFFLSPAYLSVCQGTWGRWVISWSSVHPKKLRILRWTYKCKQYVCLLTGYWAAIASFSNYRTFHFILLYVPWREVCRISPTGAYTTQQGCLRLTPEELGWV